MAPLVPKMKALMGFVASRVLPIRIPEIVEGEGCSAKMGTVAKSQKITKIMIVTDEILSGLGLLDAAIDSLKNEGIDFVLFNKVTPDPAVDLAVEGCRIYLENGCNGLLAFGGGSPMDCAKLIACLSTDPLADPKSFMGTFGAGLKFLPPIIAVPTTAGTGSEATIAAVISFPKEEKKYTIVDPRICPTVAVLDPKLLAKLPPSITAATGVDALTHAVESYLGGWRSDLISEYSLRATGAIFQNLRTCYTDGDNLEARQKLLKASFEAGVSFTRGSVGYVHAIAHQFGALFHTPHGVANAMVLPHILDFYRVECRDDLATLAIAAGLGNNSDSKDTLADRFVQGVKDLVRDLEIPQFVKGLPASSVKTIAERACNEAHGATFPFMEAPVKNMLDTGYPVPKYMTLDQCEEIVAKFVDPSAPMSSAL